MCTPWTCKFRKVFDAAICLYVKTGEFSNNLPVDALLAFVFTI